MCDTFMIICPLSYYIYNKLSAIATAFWNFTTRGQSQEWAMYKSSSCDAQLSQPIATSFISCLFHMLSNTIITGRNNGGFWFCLRYILSRQIWRIITSVNFYYYQHGLGVMSPYPELFHPNTLLAYSRPSYAFVWDTIICTTGSSFSKLRN